MAEPALWVLSAEDPPPADGLERLAQAMRNRPGGVQALILPSAWRSLAMRWAQGEGIAVLAPDLDLAVALSAGLDGVLLPAEASAAAVSAAVRAAAGRVQVVAAVHPERHHALEAAEAGADAVLFGPGVTAELAAWWAEFIEIPGIALAGDPAALEALAGSGIEFVALAPALWQG